MQEDLKKYIDFELAYEFYTARQLYDMIKHKVPDIGVTVLGRLLSQMARDKYVSRQGVKYLCRIKI